MLKQIETDLAPKPFSNYAQAIEIAPGARYMFIAGQVGADTSGNIPESPEAQHRLAWANVLAILKAAGMDHRNIVDARVFITDRSQVALYRQIRDEGPERPPGGGNASGGRSPTRGSPWRSP